MTLLVGTEVEIRRSYLRFKTCVSDFTLNRHIHMPHVIKMRYKSSMKQKQQVLFRNIIEETRFSR